MIQVASMPFSLYEHKYHWFPVAHVQRSCRSLILKPAAVVVIVDLSCKILLRVEGGGVCLRQFKYLSKCLSPLLPKSSVQKGCRFWELTLCLFLSLSCKLDPFALSNTFRDVFSYCWFKHFCYKIQSVFV